MYPNAPQTATGIPKKIEKVLDATVSQLNSGLIAHELWKSGSV